MSLALTLYQCPGHSSTGNSASYGRDALMQWTMQEASALETEQSLRREMSHLQTLVDAGTSLASRDDSAMGALQKSFSELMQEREQQVRPALTQWPCAAVFCPCAIAATSPRIPFKRYCITV